VIHHLNVSFVNAWTVIEELETLKSDDDVDPALREFASKVLANYKYPVDSQIRASDGALVRQIAANDLMSGDMVASYLAFLRGETPR